MNIDLLLDKSWTQKSEIWFDYFKKRDETLVATVPFFEFRDFYRQSIHYPMVLLIVLIILITFFSKMFIFSSYYSYYVKMAKGS